jgi:hypothetical protein
MLYDNVRPETSPYPSDSAFNTDVFILTGYAASPQQMSILGSNRGVSEPWSTKGERKEKGRFGRKGETG